MHLTSGSAGRVHKKGVVLIRQFLEADTIEEAKTAAAKLKAMSAASRDIMSFVKP